MPRPDLLLMHPPSLWDFRDRPRLAGPVSDLVPSSPVFEMYPVGFVTISDYLVRKGWEVRIVNLAVLMQKSAKFDPVRFIKDQRPKAFGIGLHWLPHAHGALEAARVAKEHHPDTPVILGGLSATYYHMEIIRDYPFVDFVLRGDSTERPLHQLMETLDKDGDLSEVPNLTWRNDKGTVKVNEKMDVPDNLDHLNLDYDIVVKSIVKYREIAGFLPTPDWTRYPVTALMFVRGCTHDCVTCGGSCHTFRSAFGRQEPAYRNPAKVVEDMVNISKILNGPIVIVGDIRLAGRSYAERIMNGIRRERIDNEVVYELFWPMSRRFIKEAARSVDNFNLSLSPESHDERVRKAQGRNFDTPSITKCISEAFKEGCKRFDLYFMLGLPEQRPESGLHTVEFCRRAMKENKGQELHCYISPLAPFLDPGSLAFEDPEAHGYFLKARTLEEHRQLLTMPSWKLVLNYETRWMTADDILRTTYASAKAMNEAKLTHGIVDQETHDRIEDGIEASLEVNGAIDGIMKMPVKDRHSALKELKAELDRTSPDILCGKGEMEWPAKGIKYSKVVWRVITGKK
jgi:B12-binding domain/radical SAM domain protein